MADQPKDALARIREHIEEYIAAWLKPAKSLKDVFPLSAADIQLYLLLKMLDELQECNRRLEHLEIQSALAAAYLGGLLEVSKEDAEKASLAVETMVREYHHPSAPVRCNESEASYDGH